MKRLATILLLCLLGLLPADGGQCDLRQVQVQQVIDGDTIRLAGGELVRYLGIDTPEIDHRAGRAEPFGRAALALNRKLVEGRRIRLETTPRKRDRYGRTLAHPLDAGGNLITLRIVAKGLAHCYPDTDRRYRRRQDELLAQQRQAMAARIGIWSLQVMLEKGRFIGNRRSLRFHRHNCPDGRKVSRRNRIVFDTRRDAHWDGYAPHGVCLGSAIKKGLKRR